MFERLGHRERIHLASAFKTAFNRRLEKVPGDLDGKRIADRFAGAPLELRPGWMRERDPDGAAIGQELDVHGVGVTRSNGQDQGLVHAVDLFTGPPVFHFEISIHVCIKIYQGSGKLAHRLESI